MSSTIYQPADLYTKKHRFHLVSEHIKHQATFVLVQDFKAYFSMKKKTENVVRCSCE